ncbi:MAG: IPT/TIG domain-containing protein [Myxococcales bacterium]|nr:IPT/TIG domain-containing protein [Myxococcales bacterium]
MKANRWPLPIILALSWSLVLAPACSDTTAPGPESTTQDTGPTDAAIAADTADAGSAPDSTADVPAVSKLALVSATPSQGKATGNEPVILTGTGFSAECQVLFDGTPLDSEAVFFVSSTEMQVQTPPHTPGLSDISVVKPNDDPSKPAFTSKLADAFLFYNDVVISKVSPSAGTVTGGTPVTISGSGFAADTKVLIGGKPAIGVSVVDDSEVLVVTPPGSFGYQPVHVVNKLGTGVLKKGFFYFTQPTIQTVAPAAGPTSGGTEVTVLGAGFTDKIQVWVGDNQASVLEVQGTTKLRINAPPGQQGAVPVKVKTKYGSSTLPNGFVYTDDKGTAATKILAIAPPKGPLAGGQTVTIVANGLVSKGDTTVLFGGKLAKISSVTPGAHTVVVKAPKGAKEGGTDVTVMTSMGSHTLKKGYTYDQSVEVHSVAPAFGPPAGNTKITIKGAGFSKGKPLVRIGALPASTVVVVSDSELQAVTPPGSPGYVNILVKSGDDQAVLPNGFAYSGQSLSLYVVHPDNGAQAGGSQVHVYGAGFKKNMQVYFGDKLGTHLSFVDPTHVIVKTPPGKVGAVPVKVQVGKEGRLLKNGFTYFNPMSKYGGTWGAAVDGTVNVTVLNSSNGQPVPDAFTMLWTDPTTPHQGFTDANGQITFSGKDVLGTQMISASKEAFESASVVKFNATNVTVFIAPIPPPSPGSPPPGQQPPLVSGKVIGLDKYVIVPAGKCYQYTNKPTTPKPTCDACSTTAQCQAKGGSGFACLDIGNGNGKRCVADCSKGQQCIAGFVCQPQQEAGGARCVPKAGELTAVCHHSKPTIFSRENNPKVGSGFEATPANGYSYAINTGFGEMAIVCFGGYKEVGAVLNADDATSMQKFTATTMGVKRHLFVGPGDNPKDVHIKLNIPLSRKASMRFDEPPTWKFTGGGYIIDAAFAYLVMGSDGVIRMPDTAQKFLAPFQSTDPDKLEIDQLPAAFTGEIFDATLSILGLVVQITGQNQMPMSASVLNDIKSTTNDTMVRRLGSGDFEGIATGVQSTIYDMWGTSSTNIYAVGTQGALLNWSGNGWTQQANFTQDDLRGVHGVSASKIWTVGYKGAAAAFDGTGWKELDKLSGSVNLNSVFATAGAKAGETDVWAAGTSGVYKLTQQAGKTGFKKYYPSPYLNAWSIHGSDKDNIWAVGYSGKIVNYNGKVWQNQASGSSIALRGVFAVGPKDVYAVGEAGQILHYNGVKWTAHKSPVKTTLHAVWANSSTDVWAVGTQSVVVHYDGSSWKKINIKEVHKSLHALYAQKGGDFFSMGEQELLIGPMIYPPLDVNPKKNGVLSDYLLKWEVDESTTQPHFNYVTIGIPGMGPDTPVWNIMAEGGLTQSKLPEFPNIQGTPGIPTGKTLRLTLIRGYKEGFDIDAYDLTDMNQLTWRSWAINTFFFTKQ